MTALQGLRDSSKPRVLLVTHAYGGGVRRHVEELARAIAADAEVLLLAPHPAGAKIELTWLAPDTPLRLFPDARADWERVVGLLAAVGIDRVHFHHVHGWPREVLDLPRRLACPHDVTLHDHFPICPQYHMLDGKARFCGGEPGCQRCLDLQPAQWNVSIDEWRAIFRPVLEGAQRVIAPSRDSAERIRRHFPGASPVVWPHPREAKGRVPRALRVLVPGAISPAKGLALLEACARDAAARALPLHFHVIGYVAYRVPVWPEVPLTIGGEYREGELPALLASAGGDAVFFPAQCAETYSFTLTDAIASGLPIVATNLGALPERLADHRDARIVRWDAPAAEINDVFMQLRARTSPVQAAAGPQVTFDEYRARYLEGLTRGRPPAGELRIEPAWLDAPASDYVGDTRPEWLFEDAFWCGRALSREKLEEQLEEAAQRRAAAPAADPPLLSRLARLFPRG